MLKTLLHKTLLETGHTFFRDKKGGNVKGGAKIGLVALYVFVFLALAASFAGLASLFFSVTDETNTWIAWALIGILAVIMATLINALTSFTQLYLAKDNEMLLSMPIKPGMLLISRMIPVYLIGLIYAAMAWLPAMIVAGAMHRASAGTQIIAFIMLLVMGVMILALTCFIGWIIAFFSTKFKSQKMLMTFIGLLFLGGIYYLQFRTNSLLNDLAEHITEAGEVIKHAIYPFYLLGTGVCGGFGGIIVYVLITAVLMAAAYLLLSRTFIGIATTRTAGTKTKFKESQIRTTSIKKALMRKERMRFTGSVTYMLNSGLGVIMMLVASVLLFIKKDAIYTSAGPLLEIPQVKALLPLAIIFCICMMESLATCAAASVSMEGRSMWLLQTMPADPLQVLMAKANFSMLMQGIPGVLLACAMCYAIGMDNSGMLAIFALAFAEVSAYLGVFMNVRHVDLEWTSESTPVKRGMAVTVTLFGGWGAGIVFAVIGYFLRNIISADIYITALVVILFVLAYMIQKWMKTTGSEMFRYL